MALVADSVLESGRSDTLPMQDGPSEMANSNGKRPAPRGTAAYPRKRAVTACQVCRARRTKCDNRKPSCSFCLKVGAQCVQSAVDLSSFDPASLKILERLDEIEQLVRQHSPSRDDGYVRLQPGSTGQLDAVRTLSVTSNPNTVAASDSSPLSHPTIPDRDSVIHPSRNNSLLPPSVTHMLTWPEFRTNEAAGARSPAPHVVSTHIDDPKLSNTNAKPLIDNFFEEVHIKNPIFNEAVTRQMVSTMLSDPELDESAESCVVLLILALGCISPPFRCTVRLPPNHPHEIARFLESMVYFQAAQKRLGSVMAAGGLVEAQCFFLSGVFMMITFRTRVAWRYFLQALACCQGFASSINEGPNDLTEAQQAIYWTAWKSECEVRATLKVPDFPIEDHAKYPPFFPTPPETLNEEGALGSSITRRQNRAWYFYLTEISLRRITTGIMQLIVEQRPRPGKTLLGALARQVPDWLDQQSQWVGSITHAFPFDSPQSEDDVCMFILRGHHANLTEIIHWPFVHSALTGSLPDSTLCKTDKQMMAMWELVNQGLVEHVSRIYLNQPGFKLQHHGTLGMVASCTRSAMVLVKAAIMAEEQWHIDGESLIHTPPSWRAAVEETLQLLEYWGGAATQIRPWLSGLRAGLERCISP